MNEKWKYYVVKMTKNGVWEAVCGTTSRREAIQERNKLWEQWTAAIVILNPEV